MLKYMTTEIIINNTPYWLAFYSSLISSIAWPFAIIIVVIILRKSIRDLISKVTNLNKLTANGIELEFREEIEEVKEAVESASISKEDSNSKAKEDSNSKAKEDSDLNLNSETKYLWNTELQYLYDIALVDPVIAIAKSWTHLIRTLTDIPNFYYHERSDSYLIKLLFDQNKISKEMYNNIITLKNIKKH